MSEEREEILRKLNRAREEIVTAGPIHRRDLEKHIRRLMWQLQKRERSRFSARQSPACTRKT